MADKQFRTEVIADPAPYKTGMDEVARIAQETAQRTAKAMQESSAATNMSVQGALNGVMGMFTKMQNLVVGAGAVIAGGGVFGKALNTSKDLTVEAQKLGRAMGVSATEASIMAVGLGDVYATSDQMLTANRAMTRELRENESGFRNLGVATRDGAGNFRSSFDIMMDVNKALTQFREGTDRNIEGQKVYKKAWEEVEPVIRLTAQVMEESKAKAQALGLVVGSENVEAVTRYRAAMNDVGDVMTAISKGVGDVVMPVFTDLGNWFSDTGPQRVEVMRKATALFISTFYGIKMVVEIVWTVIKAWVESVVTAILTFVDVAEKALTFDFAGARLAWETGATKLSDTWREAGKKIVDDAESNREKIFGIWARGFEAPAVTPTKRAEGGKGSSGGEDKNAMQRWESELKAERDAYDRKKLEQGSFEQYTLEMESAFWKKKIDLAAGNEKLLAGATAKYYDVERQIRKGAFEAEVAELKGRMQAAETNAEDRIALAAKVAELEAQRYGRASKQYKDALAEVQKATDDWAKKQREIRDLQADGERNYQLSRVELERANLDTLEKLGIIKGDEKIQRLKELKDIEFAVEVRALEERVRLMAEDPTTDPVKYQEALNKIREVKGKHIIEMAKLDGDMLVEHKKFVSDWMDPIASGFQTMTNGIIQGTRKWTDVVRSALLSVGQQYIATGLKIAMEWVKTEFIKSQATAAGVAVRTAAEATGSAASTTSTAGSAIANIGSKAWEAAASVYASIAQIPYVGPFLAPAMAVAAAAMILGFVGNIAKASGGFDVPLGASPITQLHSGEMVLPQKYADLFRGMADGGPGAGGGAPTVQMRGAPMPGGYFMVHKNEIARAFGAAVRNGAQFSRRR